MPCTSDEPRNCAAKLRTETKCSGCQDDVRRAAKKGRNHYRTHGPCQTDATREYGRRKKEGNYAV